MIWLIGGGLVVGAVLLLAAAADAWCAPPTQQRIGQPVRPTPPPLPQTPAGWHTDHSHIAIPGPIPGSGRHRRLGGTR
ncbi:hypothetical protein ACWD11_22635 [Streptomyces sp. NPDC002776]